MKSIAQWRWQESFWGLFHEPLTSTLYWVFFVVFFFFFPSFACHPSQKKTRHLLWCFYIGDHFILSGCPFLLFVKPARSSHLEVSKVYSSQRYSKKVVRSVWAPSKGRTQTKPMCQTGAHMWQWPLCCDCQLACNFFRQALVQAIQCQLGRSAYLVVKISVPQNHLVLSY